MQFKQNPDAVRQKLLDDGIPCEGLISADPDRPKGCQELAKFFDDEGNAWCSQECLSACTRRVGTITQSELNRLAQQLHDLREALRPFAFFGSSLPPLDPQVQRITDAGPMFNVYANMVNYTITCADLRRATTLLQTLEKEDYERLIKATEQKLLGSAQEQLAALEEEVDRLKETELEKWRDDMAKMAAEKAGGG